MRYLEADIPLPPQSPFEEHMIGNEFMDLLEKNPNDVDALQERLRLVEQRFAGESHHMLLINGHLLLAQTCQRLSKGCRPRRSQQTR